MTYKVDYKNSLDKLQNFLDFAIDVSDATAGRKNVPWRLVRAHQLYNRLTVIGLSFIRLLPENRYFPVSFDFWDFFSLASIARNFIENYLVFFYIGVDKVNPDEERLRLMIFNYHSNCEKFELYKLFKAPGTVLEEFKASLPMDAEKIRQNEYFKSLKEFIQKEILKGNRFMYLNRNEITSRLQFSSEEIKPFYKLFSNHTHSSPFSFYTMSDTRGRGLENEAEVLYITMAIQIVIKYLSAAIVDMTNIFPDCISSLEQIKLDIVKEEFKRKSSDLK